jgi:enoyl-CoA hydratase/carnithine racemase
MPLAAFRPVPGRPAPELHEVDMVKESRVSTERRGRVWLMGLDRAEKRNAFDLQMLRELSQAYADYEKDRELWCAVLFAEGDHFTAGLDLAEVGPAVASGAPLFPEGGIDPLDLMEPRRTKPVVCAVQGICLTIGVELLLASDIRIATRDARLAQMEVRRGIMAFGGATLRMPQVMGWGNAMRYLLTGDTIPADEALRIGLVQEVVEPGAQLTRALEIAEAVAAQAPLAVQASLRSARVAVEQGREAALASLVSEARALMATDDAREGLMSFIERRAARFSGQ